MSCGWRARTAAALAIALSLTACSEGYRDGTSSAGPRWGSREPTRSAEGTRTPSPQDPGGPVLPKGEDESVAPDFFSTGWTGSQYFESTYFFAHDDKPVLRQLGFVNPQTAESVVRSLQPDGTWIGDAAAVGDLVLERQAEDPWVSSSRQAYEEALAAEETPAVQPEPTSLEPRYDIHADHALTVEVPAEAVASATGLAYGAAPADDPAVQHAPGATATWTRWWADGRLVAEEFSTSLAADGTGQALEIVQATTFQAAPSDASMPVLAEALDVPGLAAALEAAVPTESVSQPANAVHPISYQLAGSTRAFASAPTAAIEAAPARPAPVGPGQAGVGSHDPRPDSRTIELVNTTYSYKPMVGSVALLNPAGFLAMGALRTFGFAGALLVVYAVLSSPELSAMLTEAIAGLAERALDGLGSALEGTGRGVQEGVRPTTSPEVTAPPRVEVPRLPLPRVPPLRKRDSDDDCMGKARATSEELPAMAEAWRVKLGYKPDEKNVAAFSACIDGEYSDGVAVSPQKTPPGTIGLPPNPVFHTFPLRSGDRNLRQQDSERKILERVSARTKPGSTGVLYLYSELRFCGSCEEVIDQFRGKKPSKVELNGVPVGLKGARPMIVLIKLDYHPRSS